MKNTENVTIALLAVTACILAALLVASHTGEPAYAAGESVKGGDYIMAAAQWSASTDLVYVIDIAARQMNVYFLNPNTQALESLPSMDLRRAFEVK